MYFNYEKTFVNITNTRNNKCIASKQQVAVIQRKHNLVIFKEGCAKDMEAVYVFCLPGSYFYNSFGISEKGCFVKGLF